jgi:hypothetical protein
MFKKMQDNFLEKLNKRKGEYVPVTPKSPKFQKTVSKPLTREYLDEGVKPSASVTEDKFKAALAKQMSVGASTKASKPPSSTRAVELAQKKLRDTMEQKKVEEELAAKEEQDRIAKANRVSASL